MHDAGGRDSGNFLPRPFSVVSWCFIEMEVDISNRLPTFTVAETPFDVRQNRCTKELRTTPHLGTQSEKTVNA
jgi:hypothetical protein